MVLSEERVRGDGGPRPVQHQPELLNPAAHLDAVQVVAPGLSRDHAPQGGRSHDGGLPLGLPEVGEPDHADDAIRSGELRGPLDGVVAILELVHERRELPLGGVAPPDVLDYHDVAAAGRLYGVKVCGVDWEILAVRHPGQEDGVLSA